MVEEQQHHEYGPSTLDKREACPGFVPSDRYSDHPNTLAGTRVHDAIETGDPSLLEDDREREMYELAQEVLEGAPAHDKEVRLSICGGLTFGTADVIAVSGNVAVLLDWKCGQTAVPDSKFNAQGQAYALGVFAKYPHVERVRAIFHNLRFNEVTKHTYNREDIPQLEARVWNIIRRAKNPKEKWFRMGPHCSLCDRWDCHKLVKKVADVSRRYYDELDLPEELHASRTDDPETLGKLLELAELAGNWAKNAKNGVRQAYEESDIWPAGYEPRVRSGRRNLVDPKAVYEVAQSFGLTPDELNAAVSFSVTKVEELIRERAGQGRKKEALASFFDQLRGRDAMTVSKSTTIFERTNA